MSCGREYEVAGVSNRCREERRALERCLAGTEDNNNRRCCCCCCRWNGNGGTAPIVDPCREVKAELDIYKRRERCIRRCLEIGAEEDNNNNNKPCHCHCRCCRGGSGSSGNETTWGR